MIAGGSQLTKLPFGRALALMPSSSS